MTYADLLPVTSVFRPKALPRPVVPLVAAEPAPAPQTSAQPTSIAGKWNVIVKGPTGPQASELLIETVDGKLAGVQSGQGMSSPVADLSVNGNAIRWINHVTKPLKLKVEFTATLDGDRMTGKCKAGFMGSYPFTASRA